MVRRRARVLPAAAATLAGRPAAVAGRSTGGAQASAEQRPNIVVLVADDLGWRDVGADGNAAIGTPNIDRLARSELQVERAFGTSPQCSPSRISMLTGEFAHATGTEDLHTPPPRAERWGRAGPS